MLVVTVPATEKKLVSLQSVKDELGITGTSDDALLTQYITEATATLQARCDRETFAKETVRETWRNVCHASSLIALRRPIASISTIVEDSVTLTSADYEIDGRQIFRLDGADGRACWNAWKIEVTYQAGYDLPASAPDILARACRVLVKSRWMARGRDPLVKSEEVPGVIRQDYWVGDVFGSDPDGLPAEIAGQLTRYRYE